MPLFYSNFPKVLKKSYQEKAKILPHALQLLVVAVLAFLQFTVILDFIHRSIKERLA
jgi:hypothetical protein